MFKHRRSSTYRTKTNAELNKAELEELDVQRIFPIFGDFGIVISQTKRSTLDLRSRATATPDIFEQPQSSEWCFNANYSTRYAIKLMFVASYHFKYYSC